MSLEIDVLRALLRLARRRTAPTVEQLLLRVQADEPALRRALAALVRGGLVNPTPKGPRLSLTGFAVAVAYAQRPRVSAPVAGAGAAVARARRVGRVGPVGAAPRRRRAA